MNDAATKKVPKLRFREFTGEWQAKRLGDLLDYIQPTKYIVQSTDYDDRFSTPVLTAGKTFILGYTNETDGIFKTELPAILFDDFTTASQWVDFPFKVKSSAAKILKAKPGTKPRIAYELLQGIKFKAEDHKRYWIGTFQGFKVHAPSEKEQEKIAGFLTSVDDKISALQNKKEAIEKYKKGVMQAIFSQKIRFKDENEKEYPAWQENILDKVGVTYNGLQGKNAVDFGEGSPYITYKQIFDNPKIDINKFGLVKIKEGEKQNTVKVGDAFFTTSSETPKEVGFASVLMNDVGLVYLNSFCFGFRLNKNLISSKFARFIFRSNQFRRLMYRLAQGSTRYNISKVGFLKTAVNLPCLEEQEKIADFLTAIDEKINSAERELEQAKQFKKALLQQMFV